MAAPHAAWQAKLKQKNAEYKEENEA